MGYVVRSATVLLKIVVLRGYSKLVVSGVLMQLALMVFFYAPGISGGVRTVVFSSSAPIGITVTS